MAEYALERQFKNLDCKGDVIKERAFNLQECYCYRKYQT